MTTPLSTLLQEFCQQHFIDQNITISPWLQGCCLVSKCSAPMFHCLLLDEVNVPTRMFLLAIEHFLISWPLHPEHYLSMTTLVSATHSAGICLQETSLTRTSCLSLDETEHFLHLSAKPDQCSTCAHDLWPDASQASRLLLMFLVLADVLETSSNTSNRQCSRPRVEFYITPLT